MLFAWALDLLHTVAVTIVWQLRYEGTSMEIARNTLAGMIDHTLLSPSATRGDVRALVGVASELETYSVCVSPTFVRAAVAAIAELPGHRPLVATVCGFPSGKHTPEIKAAEAAQSVAEGADEVDMVIDIGVLKAGDVAGTQAEIAAVRAAAPAPTVVKVIIEAAALTDDEIVAACRASEAAGADFVKTSTGFHPSGGASVHAVELMAKTVGGRLGVKASGGIRSYDEAAAMVEAGATRLGLSASQAVLDGAAP